MQAVFCLAGVLGASMGRAGQGGEFTVCARGIVPGAQSCFRQKYLKAFGPGKFNRSFERDRKRAETDFPVVFA